MKDLQVKSMIIKGGKIVTGTESYIADIKIEGGIIKCIGDELSALPGEEITDAKGLLVLPGAIDAHTHFDMPCGDIKTSDDFYYGTRAAVAGGTDIMVQIHEKDRRWKNLKCLLDITYLDRELRYITEDEENIYIGSLATHTDIENSAVIKENLLFLGVASSTVGSPQIRNRGTIGGSIGNAFPASDPLPALIAADARVRLLGPEGERELLLKELYEGKGKLGLKRGELIREFRIKKLPEGSVTGFSKLGRRKALAISRLNCAAALTFDKEGRITEARISPGCIFIIPGRVERAEKLLTGEKPSEELFEAAGRAVSEVMIERTGIRWSTEYKKPAVEEIVFRALCTAAGMEV